MFSNWLENYDINMTLIFLSFTSFYLYVGKGQVHMFLDILMASLSQANEPL